jgi:LacI family transcriptional regulator
MNDELAVASEAILQGHGVKVGEDIAIVGFDGIDETAHCPVPITTVRQPIEEMCSLAWSFMKSQMENPSAELRQVILVPELIIRESTRPKGE